MCRACRRPIGGGSAVHRSAGRIEHDDDGTIQFVRLELLGLVVGVFVGRVVEFIELRQLILSALLAAECPRRVIVVVEHGDVCDDQQSDRDDGE